MGRNKYSVMRFYPVYDNETGEVRFTSSTKRRFKTKAGAYLYYWCIKFGQLFMSQYDTCWRPCYIPLYSIDTDLGVSYQDAGPWRSYTLVSSGDTLEELLNEASISEVDQDGGDLDCYSLADAPSEVETAALNCIHAKIGLK